MSLLVILTTSANSISVRFLHPVTILPPPGWPGELVLFNGRLIDPWLTVRDLCTIVFTGGEIDPLSLGDGLVLDCFGDDIFVCDLLPKVIFVCRVRSFDGMPETMIVARISVAETATTFALKLWLFLNVDTLERLLEQAALHLTMQQHSSACSNYAAVAGSCPSKSFSTQRLQFLLFARLQATDSATLQH